MSSTFIQLPLVSGGGGGAVDSVNGMTGNVVITKSSIALGNVDNTSDLNKPISTATQTALNGKQDSISVGNDKFLGTTSAGAVQAIPGWTINSFDGAIVDQILAISDVGSSNLVLNRKYTELNPTEAITDSYFQDSDAYIVNGAENTAGHIFKDLFFNYTSSAAADDIYIINKNIILGNAVDSSSNDLLMVNRSYVEVNENHTSGNVSFTDSYIDVRDTATTGTINALSANMNVAGTADQLYGLNFQYTVQTTGSINSAFSAYSNPQIDATVSNLTFAYMNGYGVSAPTNLTGFGISPGYDGVITNFQGVQIGANMDEITQFTGVNIGSTLVDADNFNGVIINPQIDNLDQYANGVSINPTFTNMALNSNFSGVQVNPTIGGDASFVAGINVTMDNVTVHAGAVSSVVVQDLTFTFNQPGDNDNYTIEFTAGGVAGSEVVSIVGTDITIQIESGVSTATQVKAAWDGGPGVTAVSCTISGTASNAQVAAGPVNFAGGEWPGNKYAAFFDGDVSIQGSLQFSGALSIGKLSAFASQALVDGGGTPSSVHSLITNPTVAANVTVANADMLGVNTAALIQIGDNATVTTAFLGVSALGLPAVLTMGAGSTLDRVSGAAFALSLDAGAGGGVVDTVALCRSLALPNGTTTVNRLYGYEFDLPFGAIGTDRWGIYIKPNADNWISTSLRIGGTAMTDDKTATGYALQVTGAVLLDNELEHIGSQAGFFGVAPVSQPISSGAATAGATWTSNEQAMLQEAYDALRALGLMS